MAAVASDTLSESVEWKLIEGVFAQKTNLIAAGLTLPCVAAFSYFRTGQQWFILWGGLGIVVFFGRLATDYAFEHRRVRTGRPWRWQVAFLIGAWLSGAVCGFGAAGVIRNIDPFTQMLVMAMLTTFGMASAARNAACPNAAIGYVLLALAPMMVLCLAAREVAYMFFSVFILLYIVSAVATVRHLYGQTLRLLTTDEERIALFEEVRRSNLELAAANLQLAAMAGTDSLTGVANRRSFDELFTKEARTAQRVDANVSILMLDIDWFKTYNDRYGHPAGDECIRRIAQLAASCLRRPGDTLARYGGEEFVALLRDTDAAGAAALAEHIRATVESQNLENAAVDTGRVTVSIGVATCALCGDEKNGADTAAAVLRLADQALYEAKRAGRNCVRVAPGDHSEIRLALAG